MDPLPSYRMTPEDLLGPSATCTLGHDPETMFRPTRTTTNDAQSWRDGWEIGFRLWIDRGGQAILGKGRLELLEGIERHRSISAAARHMGMSYRHAWLLVRNINAAAGEPLVTVSKG